MRADSLDTIVAPATPIGRSALAIVRLDGPRSHAILSDLASRSSEAFPERHASRVSLHDSGESIDDCVVIRYSAPRSSTGNDMVELILHGSPAVIERVVRASTARGARLAEPGEFTERAVMNGKLDLVQAEAIGDLIASRTAMQARLSLSNLGGRLSAAANHLRGDLLHVISRFEAALDFAEEGYEFISADEARTIIGRARKTVGSILATFDRGHGTAAGLSLVILGKPNVGKSTLLNFLCGSERAIVTDLPGTTRDLLRETIEIGGLPVTVVDTAGLRHSTEKVEQIGVDRARAAAQTADLVLYLVDASTGIDAVDEEEIRTLRDALVLFTRSDLVEQPQSGAISVLSGAGLGEFLANLDERVRARFAPPEHSPTIVNERQRRALAECDEALAAALGSIQAGRTDEVVLVDLYQAASALGALTGAISREEVLREIFAKFCIGK